MNQERRNCGRKNHRNYKNHTYERTDSIVPAAWLCNDISSAVYVPIFICAGVRVEGGGRNVVECVQSGFLFPQAVCAGILHGDASFSAAAEPGYLGKSAFGCDRRGDLLDLI